MPSINFRPMRRYKIILWDLDGTLMDTGPGIFAAFRHVQEINGWPEIDDKTLHALVGPPLISSYMNTFNISEEKAIESAHLHRLYQKQSSYQLSTAYPGMAQLLQVLKKRGYLLAVSTLKGEEIARKTLSAGNLTSYFDGIFGVTPDHIKARKSDIINRALNAFSLEKQDAVLVGDSRFDGLGAWENNMPFIAVTYGYGFHNIKEARTWHPLHIAPSVKDLSSFLSKI
jgi:phosphoglycolate phosphatase